MKELVITPQMRTIKGKYAIAS